MLATLTSAAELRAAAIAYRFRESLFLLPATIVAAGAVVAVLAAEADRRLGPEAPAWLPRSDAGTATWVLATIAGAMITTAGVVFSLTVVSLQLASSQLSPRVMRSFIRDRISQVVIGALVATFVHCMLTLRRLPGEATAPGPPLGVTIAVTMSLATVLLIVAHLDHLARRLQVGEIVRGILDEGLRTIDRVDRVARREQRLAADAVPEQPADAAVVPSPRDGWVTSSLSHRMMRLVPPGTVVRLETRTGAYIHAGEPLVTLWPADPRAHRRLERVAAGIGIADARTMQEDVDFAIRQLVDIGLRALSPAVNDPTTAVEAILRLGGLMRRLLTAELPAEVAGDAEGRVVVRPWDLTPDEYVDHAFEQLRHSGADQPLVMAALVRVLRMLLLHLEQQGRPADGTGLQRHLDLVEDAVGTGRGITDADVDRVTRIARSPRDPAEHLPDA
ncbi:DUF2254 domain-containing protein [Actinotalea ferrariae]|nr:DUF2254 domain-containing protein [Actinotalea ferrariae]